jgi:hypothetical protein
MRIQSHDRLAACTLAILSLEFGALAVLAAGPPMPDKAPAIDEPLSNLAQRIVVESLPRQFEDKKNWGKTTRIVNSFRFKNDGDGLKLRKHTEEVKDGLWKQYRAEVVDPEHQLQIRVANIKQTDAGHSAFQVFLSARLRGEAQLEQWKDGLKLFNVSAQADSKVEVRLDCEMAWSWKASGILGQFSVEPKVTGARIELVEFDLKKVSKIEGWAARELGENLKGIIAKKLHDEEPKLVEKLNKAIAKRQDRLRFSPDAVVAGGLSELESLFSPKRENGRK